MMEKLFAELQRIFEFYVPWGVVKASVEEGIKCSHNQIFEGIVKIGSVEIIITNIGREVYVKIKESCLEVQAQFIFIFEHDMIDEGEVILASMEWNDSTYSSELKKIDTKFSDLSQEEEKGREEYMQSLRDKYQLGAARS